MPTIIAPGRTIPLGFRQGTLPDTLLFGATVPVQSTSAAKLLKNFETCVGSAQWVNWPDMLNKTLLLSLLVAGLIPHGVLGEMIGDPAPPVVVAEWIKGGPVTVGPGTNIFVVEIWTTTSMGSRACITNLNHLQERFKTNGVVVIGISDEPVEKIKEFVQNGPGTNIAYAVAADDRKRTVLSFMAPLKVRGVPFAFVVGTNGNVDWYGPPGGGLNLAMKMILAGQYDVDYAKKQELGGRQMEQYVGLASRGDFRAKSAGQLLLANRTNDVELLCDLAYQICTDPQISRRDFALAGQALDQAEELEVTNKARVMIIRAVWLFASGKQDAGGDLWPRRRWPRPKARRVKSTCNYSSAPCRRNWRRQKPVKAKPITSSRCPRPSPSPPSAPTRRLPSSGIESAGLWHGSLQKILKAKERQAEAEDGRWTMEDEG